MTAISCKDLCKYFQQGDTVVKALDHVSLEIQQGEFICLSGPSGSGKTTLLNAIGGLDKLDSGEVSIGEYRVDQLEAKSSKESQTLIRVEKTLCLLCVQTFSKNECPVCQN